MHLEGKGTPVDEGVAFEWLLKAAMADYTPSMNLVGQLYSKGLGTKQDKAAAINWYTKGAAEGGAGAMFSLGRVYENGDGVTKDHSKAVEWYRKAAAAGDQLAADFVAEEDRLDAEAKELKRLEPVRKLLLDYGTAMAESKSHDAEKRMWESKASLAITAGRIQEVGPDYDNAANATKASLDALQRAKVFLGQIQKIDNKDVSGAGQTIINDNTFSQTMRDAVFSVMN